MFKEYKLPGEFINGYRDYCVENGVKALLYAGTTDEGLPIGVQLIGDRQSDSNLLKLASEVEAA